MTEEDVKAMLDAVGVSDISELFSDVPEDIRAGLDLPGPMDEVDLHRHLEDLASLNTPAGPLLSFLGGGVYDHHIPPAVTEIASRAEFLSAYTPYQPEMIQGMLQAIF
jgi:glycine dehydrogenase subunit 1